MNDNLIILPLASRASTATSPDLDNPYYAGAYIALTVTASGIGSGVVLTVEGKDDYSEYYYTLATSSSQALNGTTIVKVYPGLTAGTNTVSEHLPRTWRVKATHTSAITYSVSASYLD